MPTPKQKPAPDFIAADPDFIPAGNSPDTTNVPRGTIQPEQDGFLKSFAKQYGYDPDAPAPSIGKVLLDAAGGPALAVGKGVFAEGKRIAGEVGGMYEGAKEHNPYAVLQHAITAVPLAGPLIHGVAEHMNDVEGQDGDDDDSYLHRLMRVATDPSAMGSLTAGATQIAPMVEGLSRVGDDSHFIPSAKRAGNVFQSIAADVKGQPVALTRSTPFIERAQQLSDAGHGTIAPIDSLYRRMNTVNPIDYDEAFDRSSALKNLTKNDKMRATRTLVSQARQLSHALTQDIGDTAASVGRGEHYNNAMKEYRRAAAMKNLGQTAVKVAIPAAAAASAEELYNAFK
jgi:hypothetical protein